MNNPAIRTFQNFPQKQPSGGGSQPGAIDFESDRRAEDIQRLVERLSRWMDSAFEVPVVGWRFGWDALIGLVPGVGDAGTTFVAFYIVALAAQAGVPRVTIARMGLNVAIDMLLGSLPVVGDLFDVYWKANLRNAELLSNRLAESPRQARRASIGDWFFVGGIIAALSLLFVAILATFGLALAALWRVVVG